jgi:hypothetical protein
VRVALPPAQLAEFCRRWSITELAVFGSAVRDDFGPASDLDVLVRFDTGVRYGLLDVGRMEEDLALIAGRPVDVVTRQGLEASKDHRLRDEIERSSKVVYACAKS